MEEQRTQLIERLAEPDGDELVVSIYLPTEQAGRETRQNPIRYKNLVQAAAAELKAAGRDDAADQAMLAAAADKLHDAAFWQHKSAALAVFMRRSGIDWITLDTPVDEQLTVAPRHHLLPLLRLQARNLNYYLLNLDLDHTQLWRGDRHRLEPVAAGDRLPRMKAFMEAYVFEKNLGAHAPVSAVTGSGARSRTTFHGHGGTMDDQGKKYITELYHRLDDAVREQIGDGETPLLLAGPAHLIAQYRTTNGYPHLLDEHLEKDVTGLDDAALKDRAWTILRRRLEQQDAQTLGRYGNLAGSGQTADTPEAIVETAADGAIDTLIVNTDASPVWGRFSAGRPAGSRVSPAAGPGTGIEDLRNLAALFTFRNGGRLCFVDAAQLSDQNALQAIYRYPVSYPVARAG
jgi:hypothetical protein